MAHYESNRCLESPPFFSICIPQYNRTDFLIKACTTYRNQTFVDFELCISDDCSTDNRQDDLLGYLRGSGLVFTYAKQSKNLRYDGNLRSAIALSTGKYVLLMGNDDGLSDPHVLKLIRDQIASYCNVAVAMTNFRELSTGMIYRRSKKIRVAWKRARHRGIYVSQLQFRQRSRIRRSARSARGHRYL